MIHSSTGSLAGMVILCSAAQLMPAAQHRPASFLAWLSPFLGAFSRRTRPTAAALAAGALLAVGPRTVTNCLRALDLAAHPGAKPPGFASFTAFHRVLNRNTRSGL